MIYILLLLYYLHYLYYLGKCTPRANFTWASIIYWSPRRHFSFSTSRQLRFYATPLLFFFFSAFFSCHAMPFQNFSTACQLEPLRHFPFTPATRLPIPILQSRCTATLLSGRRHLSSMLLLGAMFTKMPSRTPKPTLFRCFFVAGLARLLPCACFLATLHKMHRIVALLPCPRAI